ncbi:MAG: hypothetical protein LUQ65_12730 [Candidatus Helarchaeota archaeon]|nr:hypothetical protein [Candidatus Helarchaeota archaeon]
MDKQMFLDQIEGLKISIEALRETERIHIKVTTLTEQIEKARVEKGELETKIEGLKKQKIDLKFQKANSLNNVAKKIEDQITKLLPNGQAVFTIGEDGVFIGLKHHGDKVTPYLSLSGGEKAFFDPALCVPFLGKSDNKILLIEAAEMDPEKLSLQLQEILNAKSDIQWIVSSCHEPKKIPERWEVTRL